MHGLPAVSQAPAGAPKNILGLYGLAEAGHDSIRVTETGGGKIGVALKLYYANGHTCQLKEDGEWREGHVAVVVDGLEPNRQCKLSLYFQNGHVLLKDEGLRCAPVYCGTRGKLDNVSLPKSGPNRK